MESMGWKIVGGADDFEIEAETRKQPKGGYMYFYMAECKRMKGDGTQSGSVKKDVRSKWNSMSDAEKEPYITQSRNDSKEYKERRKALEIRFWIIDRSKGSTYSEGIVSILDGTIDVSQCMAKYGDYSFPLGVSTAAAVLGVQNKGKSVIEVCRSKNWKALASKYGLNHKVTYAEVEDDIKSGSYWGDELKARVLLYLVGIFLCPTGDTSTNKEYMKLICDEGLKGEFNWAEYIHSRLIESIITFKKGSQRYLKGCIAILEVIGKDVEEQWRQRRRKEGWLLGDDGEWDDGEAKQSNFDILMSELADIKKIQFEIMQRQSRVEEKLGQVVEKLERVEDTLERHKGVVEGKIDGVVNEVEVLRGEVVKEVGWVVDKYSDEGAQLKEEKREEEEEMEEMRRKEVDVIYTPESVIAAVLDSECPAPQKKKQKIFCNLNGNQFATVYDVATLKPTEWVGGVVIDLLAWTICYDSQKSLRRIGYLPYLLVQQALEANNKESVESISTFWGVILDNYVKFTDCEKIMITINYHNSHWYLLVLDMVDHVVTIYDSMFTTEAAKQRVNDAKRLIKILDSYNKKRIWVESCGSLGKYPLKNFKFVEHKKNKQLNGYDCGMYVMMWMESIGSTGQLVVGDWDRSRVLNDLVSHNQNERRQEITKAAILHKNNKRMQ
ncbi:hypothetical protein F3Y22_tig00110059pilonHSYRG00125 [Hibiscus syriacus]|uniref:Ubiquitin-like protease family profile domain-containing protein n=1 Tax=Hibiscus syriacus TaxID=106335 RepID=A0A6A3BQD4_HIBSY|nr:hypothetical protein F3Y22_tig00110059pilonHSYRG00125 [Hibiscus syriacus]